MAVRIRYEVYDDPKGEYDLVSVRNFHAPVQDSMYIVYINSKTCEFKIKNMSPRGRVYVGGDGVNNLQVLKRQAKSKLAGLGVKFDAKEIRDNSSRVKGVNCSYKQEKDDEV